MQKIIFEVFSTRQIAWLRDGVMSDTNYTLVFIQKNIQIS